MKESYRESLANSSDPEPYAGGGDVSGVASGKGDAGQPSSSEIIDPECRSCSVREKAALSAPLSGEAQMDTAESETLSMCLNSKRENRDIRSATVGPWGGEIPGPAVRPGNATGDTAGMDVERKSDGSIVPVKPSNNSAADATAVATVLRSVYEEDFIGFSYGFRKGRSQHDALDALNVAITSTRVNWVLDADIQGFFDAIDHEWLIKFPEHRVWPLRGHQSKTAW